MDSRAVRGIVAFLFAGAPMVLMPRGKRDDMVGRSARCTGVSDWRAHASSDASTIEGSRIMRVGIIGTGLIVVGACSDVYTLERESKSTPELGALHAALDLSGENDVTAVRLDVLAASDDCGDTPIVSEVVTVADETGAHQSAGNLFVLGVGDYRVCATPLAGQAASELCEATEGQVEVLHEVTAELQLVVQCVNPDQGGIEAVVSLNDAPSIVGIELAPSGVFSVCEAMTAVASATDPNGDHITYTWSVTSGPSGYTLQAAEATATFSAPSGEYEVMLQLDDGHGGNDSLTFPVSVTDAPCDGGVDTTPPGPVTGLLAAIESRRETSVRLTWTPPAEAVAGYDVAYLAASGSGSVVTISDATFDQAIQAPDVSGSNTVVVHDLTIETGYVFAVRPYDAAGNRGAVVSTSSPVKASFEALVMAPPPEAGPGAQWGFSVDASTDLDGDGTADLVVGQKYGDRVSIYLGQSGGTYATEPNAVIVGPAGSGFGQSVAVIGNVLGGGHEDIAIAAPTDGPVLGRVYLVSGRAWTNEVLDLSDGTNPTGSIVDFPTTTPYPAHVVRLGDFDGDGDDDFGVHALGYGVAGPCDPEALVNCEGAFLLIKGVGNPSNFPSLVEVPTDAGMFEAYFPSAFGFYGSDWLLGITDFVGGRSGVLAAEYQAGVQRILTRDTSASAGFDAEVLDYGPPQFSGDTVVYDTEIGSYPAALLGSSLLAIQLTNARDGLGTSPGIVDLYTLSADSPFAVPYKTFKAGGDTNNFGQILIGNRFSGRDSSYNLPLFGRDAEAPALVMGGRLYAGKLPKLFMLNGDSLASLPNSSVGVELTGVADVELPLSSLPGLNRDWVDALGEPNADADWHGGIGFGVHDMNGDGFADIGVTEWEFEGAYTGGIVVLY